MNNDIRIAIGFFDHPKTVKLQRKCGAEGVISLQRLWEWVSQNKSSGNLTGMDIEDIEIAAKWNGEPGAFYEAIVGKFIDISGEEIKLHDWKENNSWVAGSVSRGNKGRLNRMKSTHPAIYKKFSELNITGISKSDYALITTSEKPNDVALSILEVDLSTTQVNPTSPAPSPSPSPAPAPKSKDKTIVEQSSLDHVEVIKYLNLKSGKNFKPNAGGNKSIVEARISEGFMLEDFKLAVDHQCRDWLGTDMEQYLRPDTLFRKSKFDGYVNNIKTSTNLTDNEFEAKYGYM